MIKIKTEEEIRKMREAGKIVYEAHRYIEPFIKPGVTTKELDDLLYDFITKKKNSYPSFKGLYGFKGSCCFSVNDEVVHGIPGNRVLKEGDIVSIDIGASFDGYHGDSAWTYPVGKITEADQKLLDDTREILYQGLNVIKDGAYVGDIGYAIGTEAQKRGLGVVRELAGHGVGREVHEEPTVYNFGKRPRTGAMLKAGMVIAVEPMLTLGSPRVYQENDGWTIKTIDGSNAAHFEHTIVVLKDGYKILTGEWFSE